jgi:hypothetical protein
MCAGWMAIAAGCDADIGSPSDEQTGGNGGSVDGGGTSGGSDAAHTADAAPEDCVEGWSELLVNGDFDEGPEVGWTSTGAVIIHTDAEMPINVDSGEYAAWLGGRNELDATLSQPVQVPAQASDLRFTARTCFVTVETAGGADQVEIVLLDGNGDVAGTLSDFDNQDAGGICNWGSLQISSSPAHAGEDLTFAIHVTTNAANHTSFYFDTLTLEALSECGG